MKIWDGKMLCLVLGIFPNFNVDMISTESLTIGQCSRVVVTWQGLIVYIRNLSLFFRPPTEVVCENHILEESIPHRISSSRLCTSKTRLEIDPRSGTMVTYALDYGSDNTPDPPGNTPNPSDNTSDPSNDTPDPRSTASSETFAQYEASTCATTTTSKKVQWGNHLLDLPGEIVNQIYANCKFLQVDIASTKQPGGFEGLLTGVHPKITKEFADIYYTNNMFVLDIRHQFRFHGRNRLDEIWKPWLETLMNDTLARSNTSGSFRLPSQRWSISRSKGMNM